MTFVVKVVHELVVRLTGFGILPHLLVGNTLKVLVLVRAVRNRSQNYVRTVKFDLNERVGEKGRYLSPRTHAREKDRTQQGMTYSCNSLYFRFGLKVVLVLK